MGFGACALESLDLGGGVEGLAFKSRMTCRVCASRELRLILDYGEMPLAGGFFEESDPRSERTFPLHLVLCEECGLLQVQETVDPRLIFETYSYVSSVNRTLVAHNRDLAFELASLCPGDGLIVEIGCNDGVLLNPLTELGKSVLGVDPSDVAKKASADHGWPLLSGYFDRAAAKKIVGQYGEASVIAANNVCAHLDDPNEMMAGVAELLAPQGSFVFEVHYQGDLVAGRQYDTVYHEHTCYYSVTSLRNLLLRHGLIVVDVTRIPIHGGSIRVRAMTEGASVKAEPSVQTFLDDEAELDLGAFAEEAERHRRLLHQLIADLRSSGKKIVAYGASGRGTVMLNFCKLGPNLLDHVSDLSPLRYHRVVPGVKVPILSREQFSKDYPSYALMTAWNYEKEIVEDERNFLASGGSFIVPLPQIRLR